MRQEHHADRERAETELGRVHDLACPANRATAMANAELGGNDENVVTRLLVAELRELSLRLGELTQVLRTEATLTEVVELAVAGFRDQCEDPLDGFAIGRRNRLPARDGEPSLGPGRNRNVATFDVGRPEVREQRLQYLDLLGNRLDLVARQVAIVGGGLLVSVLVRDGEFSHRHHDRHHDTRLEVVAVLDELLQHVFF